jgi:hypothetical protein
MGRMKDICFSSDTRISMHRMIGVCIVREQLQASDPFESITRTYINCNYLTLALKLRVVILLINNVTDWAVARRRIGEHFPTNPHPTIEGRPLLGNRPVNTHHSNDSAIIKRLFSTGSAPRSYLEDN